VSLVKLIQRMFSTSKKKKSHRNYNVTTNLIKIPEKILNKINKNDVNSTDDSIKLNKLDHQVQMQNTTDHIKVDNKQEFYNKVKEFLYLIRPVIYLSTLICFKKNKLIPLVVSMVIEYMYMDSKGYKGNNFSKQKIYYAEHLYRQRRLLLYLLREPIFSYVTLPSVKKVLSFIRLPETIIRWVEEILKYFTKLYYIV